MDAMGFAPDPALRTTGLRIGCIGAGMIMAECHLAAYAKAGFPVVAIASRTRAKAEAVAARYGIAVVHDTPGALIADPAVEILDLAYPPDLQPALIRAALKQPHIKGSLAQKPLALSLTEAIALGLLLVFWLPMRSRRLFVMPWIRLVMWMVHHLLHIEQRLSPSSHRGRRK